jgi:hypothetical protein
MNFVYLDIDDPANDQFKAALDYKYQPHLFLLDAQGNKIKEWLGLVTREDLESAFKASLSQ